MNKFDSFDGKEISLEEQNKVEGGIINLGGLTGGLGSLSGIFSTVQGYVTKAISFVTGLFGGLGGILGR